MTGNPGGRPKVLGDVQELAREHSTEAIATLAAIMRDKRAPPAARAMASNSILDRAYGKPPQTLNANVANRPVNDMTDAELLAIAGSEPIEPESQTEH
jgi:hypothetical protein